MGVWPSESAACVIKILYCPAAIPPDIDHGWPCGLFPGIQALFFRSVQPRILTEDGELSRRVVEQKTAVLPWEGGGHVQIDFGSIER
jgi:hypothetical protein